MTRVWNGYHITIALIAFFAVIFSVDGFFIIKAVTTFRGEDEQMPYLQGVAYNDTLDRRALQAQLGWTATIAATRFGRDSARIEVSLLDRTGKPAQNVGLVAELKHPSDAGRDRSIPLHRTLSGPYVGAASGIEVGVWDLVVTAHDAPATPFEAGRRIWLH